MIRINLLPFRAARKKENIRRQVSMFLLFFILCNITLFYFHISLSSKVKNRMEDVDEIQAELNKKQKDVKAVNEIKKELSILQKKMDVMEKLDLNRKMPVRLLESMTDLIIPKRMWFKTLDEKGKTVTINGIALDNKTVADFMTNLEESLFFSSVNLKNLVSTTINKLKLKQFNITCEKAALKKPAK